MVGKEDLHGQDPEATPARRYRRPVSGDAAAATAGDWEDGAAAGPGTAGPGTGTPPEAASGPDDGWAATDLTEDVLIRGLFAIGLDLHTALAHLEQHVAEDVAIARVRGAIGRIDEAIKEIRRVTFGRLADAPPLPCGMWSMVVDAVGRACGPAGRGPVITLRGGADSMIDTATSQRLAALVQEILSLVPDDRLPRAHVEVRPDPRPPGRLVVQIDVPGDDLHDVARLLGAARVHGVAVSSQAVGGAPGRSRIRIECPAAAS